MIQKIFKQEYAELLEENIASNVPLYTPEGFAGLIIPHISRAFAGTNHKRLVPVVILLGAIFLIWADVLARVLVKNAELPIGIFTALVGAPFFIYIVTKKNYGRE